MSNLLTPVPDDHDLDFLYKCTSEDLDLFISILLKGGTNWLDTEDVFKKYYPDHTKYIREAIADFQRFGGNTLANMWRDLFSESGGVPYRKILIDVCDNQKVRYEKSSAVEEIENVLLDKVVRDVWGNLSYEEKLKLLKELAIKGAASEAGSDLMGTGLSIVLAAFRSGGFASYKLSLIIANGVAKAVLGRGLTLGANAMLAKGLSVLAGPVGWAISGMWTAIDVAGPAMRITVPATVAIAVLRHMKTLAWKCGGAIAADYEAGKYSTCKMRSQQDSSLTHSDVGQQVSLSAGEWKWKCCNCGFVHHGMTAPDRCSRCGATTRNMEWMGE